MPSYLRPQTLAEALAALAQHPRTIIAGGTDHFPARATHTPPEHLLDITALEGLATIARQGPTWRIPALATWTTLAETPLPPLFDALKQAATQIGGRQIQNAATLVGNVCNASPAADSIPPLLAMDAQVELQSTTTTRTLPLSDFLIAPRQTARRPDELVTALLIPHTTATSRFEKLGARRYLVISITMVATSLTLDPQGRITQAAIAVGACTPVATRLPALEAALLGHPPHPALVHPEHLGPLSPIDDVRAPAAYRLDATLTLLRRALATLAAPQAQAA